MTKPILAIVGGFMLAFGMFVGGLVFAIVFLVPGETSRDFDVAADASGLSSVEPRPVNALNQGEEPVRAVAGNPIKSDELVTAQTGEPGVDPSTTGAIASEQPATAAPADPAAERLLQAHVGWCARTYRSYQPRDNSYRPYNGGRRKCVSPFSTQYAELTGTAAPSDPHVRFAPLGEEASPVERAPDVAIEPEIAVDFVADAGEFPVLDDAHVRNCFSRYRSYRPEDNSYQPLGGGPRRQCE